ncbi:MAG: methionine--tRNA ligase, partial [Alphaproteobacteria bacterium]|nr:methionine--tRNA ligase [Alphaproteobacteria bacterium]
DWGVPVPGAPRHVMYVWVDALSNYITALGYPDDDNRLLHNYWPADCQLIGKDIVRFHAIYWPAFLMSAGLPLPAQVYGHGFIYNRGEKMSKSVGNVITPAELIDEYGCDQLRYFLLREVAFGQDGSYSHDAIISRINSDLANDLGNLAQRTLSQIAKNCDEKIPPQGDLTQDDQQLFTLLHNAKHSYHTEMKQLAFHRALEALWHVIAECNRYIDAQAPWSLKKTDVPRMQTVLHVIIECVRQIAILLRPFMPTSMDAMLDQLAIGEGERGFSCLDHGLVAGAALPVPQGVFPRYQVAEQAEQKT